MRRADLVVVLGVVALVGFVVAQGVRAPRPPAAVTVETLWVDDTSRATAQTTPGVVGSARVELATVAPLPAPPRDTAAIRALLESAARGTYLADLLAARDSNVARWPDRLGDPLRVWIQPAPALDGWSDAFPAAVRAAFTDWAATGIPLAFSFVTDSARAEIHVGFVDRFADGVSGRTRWARDAAWWIRDAGIELALHYSTGERVDVRALRAIALHEVGHLIGLDHTRDPTCIMAPRVQVEALAGADIATVRLVYRLPPGSVKGATGP